MPLDSATWSPSPVVENDSDTVLLKEARALIERGWCKGAYAKNSNGDPVVDVTEGGIAWCAVGALRFVVKEGDALHRLLLRVSLYIHPRWQYSVIRFNDDINTTKRDVLEVFDLAINNGAG